MFNQPYIKKIVIVFFAVIVIATLFGVRPSPSGKSAPPPSASYIAYSEFDKKLQEGQFKSITQSRAADQATAIDTQGKMFRTYLPVDADMTEKAAKAGVIIHIAAPPVASSAMSSGLGTLFIVLLPVLLLIGYMHWSRKQQEKMVYGGRGGQSGAGGGSGREWVISKNTGVKLDDVAGCDELRFDVAEIVQFLQDPERYSRVGARSPKGVLMSGPPGTGKTLLARAIAGEAGVPFISASGSDFVEMFVGVGAARVRDMFRAAKDNAPCIIFIDEIDSVGRRRSSGNVGGGDSEREQTLNQILTEMDGFGPSSGVIVIAATNRSDILDPALTRPGRFDREVTMTLPDRNARAEILRQHARTRPVADDVSWPEIARGTSGFSGAELANLVNEAAMAAARDRQDLVTRAHVLAARDKIIMGVRLSPMKNDRDRRIVAYHEAGHALVAHVLPDSPPVHKISIVPRGRALGVTVRLPEEDTYNSTAEYLHADIAVLMGGRAAEHVALSVSTTGASNDFMRATQRARQMVAMWGLDPDIGPVVTDNQDPYGQDHWSEETRSAVDRRVRDILNWHYTQACALLKKYRPALDAVAERLLEDEDMEADAFEEIMNRFGVAKQQSIEVVPPGMALQPA